MISELEAILDNIDQITLLKLIKKIFKGTKFNTIERETVTGVNGGVKLHFKFLDGTEIVSPLIYELTDADVTQLKEKVAELETRIETLEQKTDDLQDDIDAIRTIVNQLSTDLTTLTERVTQAEEHLDEHDQDISTLEVEVANLKNEMPVANNGEATTATLDTLKVKGVNYKVPSGGTGTDDYNNLNNKPTIDGVELTKGKTHSDLGLLGLSDKAELQAKVQQLENDKADKTELPVANNGETATTDLSTLKVGGVNYKIPSGGSGGKLYNHYITVRETNVVTPSVMFRINIIDNNSSPYDLSTLGNYLSQITSTNNLMIANGVYIRNSVTHIINGVTYQALTDKLFITYEEGGTALTTQILAVIDDIVEIN